MNQGDESTAHHSGEITVSPSRKRKAAPNEKDATPEKRDAVSAIVGSQARTMLFMTLSRARNPITRIKQFQTELALSSEANCDPALPFVDLLGGSRPELYFGLLKALRERLSLRLKNLDINQIDGLLQATFPYIGLPELKPIALEVLRLHPNIPNEFRNTLNSNQGLLAECAIDVKRQVWVLHPTSFRNVARPLLAEYVRKLKFQAQTDDLDAIAKISPRGRRNTDEIRELLTLVGPTLMTLYNAVLELIRSEFMATGDVAYAAARTDLLMSLHDAGVAMVKKDPCEKFVRTLVSCVADRTVDETQAAAISDIISTVNKNFANPAILGDLMLIILDPCISYTLARACYDVTKTLVSDRKLPAESKHLQYLMHAFASVTVEKTRLMIREQRFEPITKNQSALWWFCPVLASAMVSDLIATEKGGAEAASSDDANCDVAVPSEVTECLCSAPALRMLVMFYVRDALVEKNFAGTMWGLGLLTAEGEWRYGNMEESSTDEQFARMLISRVLGKALRGSFASNIDAAVAFMVQYALPRATHSSAAHVHAVQLVGLLWRDATGMARAKVERLIADLCRIRSGGLPGGPVGTTTEVLVQQYNALVVALPATHHLRDALVVRVSELKRPRANRDKAMERGDKAMKSGDMDRSSPAAGSGGSADGDVIVLSDDDA